MDMIPLPTDNLYKFIALSGVTLAVGALYASARFLVFLRERLMNAVRVVERAKVQKRHLTRDIGRAEAANPSKEEVVELRRRNDELELLTAELEVDQRYSAQLLKDMYFLVAVSICVFVVGATMASWGFKRWYADATAEASPTVRPATVEPPIRH